MDKKQCILNYAQRQTPKDLSTLGFTIIKADRHFKKAYAMHDVATAFVVQQYLSQKCVIHPVGVDLRKQEVIIEDELPDYLVEKKGDIFCFDVKSKSSEEYFGWVNERAVESYRKLYEACDVPVYLIFAQVVGGDVKGKVGFCDVRENPVRKTRAWNGNVVWIFSWKEGLAP